MTWGEGVACLPWEVYGNTIVITIRSRSGELVFVGGDRYCYELYLAKRMGSRV